MKKAFLIGLCTLFLFTKLFAQKISIANERMNIFYVGLDNPISIAVDGFSTKNLTIKATNGKIEKDDYNSYLFRPKNVGPSEIIVYSKINGKLKEIGRSQFRCKNLPLPTFHIGSGKKIKSKNEIAAQEYVRAELENFDIDIRYQIDSFKVCIFSGDTCKYYIKKNIGNKLNDEVKSLFKELQNEDVIVFKDIFIKEPDGTSALIAPLIITIKD